MALTTVRIDKVTPTGGPAGTAVVVTGAGFGVTQGSVILDPLGTHGAPLPASFIALWQDDRVEFVVPAGVAFDRFSTLLVEKDGGGDSADVPFWVPAEAPLSADGLDYQYPAFEEGDYQDEDDPRVAAASDINRLMSRVAALSGAAAGAGWLVISDIAPAASGVVGGKVFQTAAEDVLQSCLTDTLDLRVTVTAAGPRVRVSGVTADLPRIAGESHYSGDVNITITGTSTITATQIMPDGSDGARVLVDVTYQLGPNVLTCEFTGGYPGTQTELKAGDTFQLTGTISATADRIEILDYGAMDGAVVVIAPGTSFTITGTIADRGTTTQDLAARVRARSSWGAWGATFDTDSTGSVDGVNTVKLNNTYPSVVFGAITYPGSQLALKGSETASVAVTTTNLDTIAYDSPVSELSITNPTLDETGKTVERIAGTYNISTPNLRATATRAANNAVTVATVVVWIADAAVVIGVTLPAARLRSGGNDGTSIQGHTITIVANQRLLIAPTMNAAPGGGTFIGAWTGGPLNWTRTLNVHDNDTKGGYSWVGLVATNLAGVVTSVISSGATYTLGGFVARNVTFAPFSQSVQINVPVVTYTKLQAGKFTATNQDSIRNPTQGNQSDLANTYTVLALGASPTTVWWNDVAAASANSSGTAQLLALEETA